MRALSHPLQLPELGATKHRIAKLRQPLVDQIADVVCHQPDRAMQNYAAGLWIATPLITSKIPMTSFKVGI